jgi:hypothetical protein
MRFAYAHRSDKTSVRQRLNELIPQTLAHAGGLAQNFRQGWHGDTLSFSFSAMGRSLAGTAVVTDTEIVVDVGVPLMFRAFEGKAKSRILDALDKAFG